MDDLKHIIRLARHDASVEKREMVIGRQGDRWTMVPKDDPASDQVRPGIIVDETGVVYPEHRELVAKILSGKD